MLDISKLKTGKTTTVTLTVLNLVAPGLLGLFFLKHQLFLQLDVLKLLLTSICLSAPFLMISFGLSLLFFENFMVRNPVPKQDSMGEKFDTEDNDHAVLLLSNILAITMWFVCMLHLVLFPIAPNDYVEVAKSIAICFVGSGVTLVLVACIIAYINRRRIRR